MIALNIFFFKTGKWQGTKDLIASLVFKTSSVCQNLKIGSLKWFGTIQESLIDPHVEVSECHEFIIMSQIFSMTSMSDGNVFFSYQIMRGTNAPSIYIAKRISWSHLRANKPNAKRKYVVYVCRMENISERP